MIVVLVMVVVAVEVVVEVAVVVVLVILVVVVRVMVGVVAGAVMVMVVVEVFRSIPSHFMLFTPASCPSCMCVFLLFECEEERLFTHELKHTRTNTYLSHELA